MTVARAGPHANSEQSTLPHAHAPDIPDAAGAAVRERFGTFGSSYRWLLLFSLLCGSLSTMLAATTINVALPSIIGAFGLGQDKAQWMSTAFLAASTIAMLANAWAMSAFGTRATYLVGLTLFISGSVLGAVSSTFGFLVIARALQGIAAGLLQPMSMYLIFQTFQDNKRGTAIGIFSIGVVLAPAFGPALGGFAVDLSSWRLVFIATLPIALFALPLAAMLMPGRDSARGTKAPPLDWLGLTLIGIAVVGLLSTIANGDRDGWYSDRALIRLAVSIAAGIAFFWWERRHPFPALDLHVFQHWQFASAGIIIAFTGTAIYGSTYLIPIFVQMVQHYSPTAAGVMMIPAGLAMVIGFPIAGRLSDRFDTRLLLAFGIICFGASMYLLAGIAAATSYWMLIGWIILGRVGISFCMPPANTTAIRGVPSHLLASAAGAASFLMQVGGAFGVTMLAILLQRRIFFHGEHLSSAMTERNPELLHQHQQNMWTAMTNGEPYQQAFVRGFRPIADAVRQEALVLAFRDSFLVCSLGFAIVLMFTLLLPKPENKAMQR